MSVTTVIVVIAACLMDRWLGEPRRWHPLVGFGWLAAAIEKILNSAHAPRGQESVRSNLDRARGILALALLVFPLTALAFWVQWQLLSLELLGRLVYALLAVLVLYWALGWRSLVQHLEAIRAAFASGDIDQARDQVGRIVSRDCESASWLDLRRAAIESGLENTNDAIVAPLFWFLLAGLPGAVLYRLSNTLDALWGYRTARYQYFGWAAARWDDLLNYLPARLTALAFALAAAICRAPQGSVQGALNAWRTQAPDCASPNAGPVMCSGAGALGVRLGGPARYQGGEVQKPWFGGPRSPEEKDMERALGLIRTSLSLLLVPVLSGLLLIGR